MRRNGYQNERIYQYLVVFLVLLLECFIIAVIGCCVKRQGMKQSEQRIRDSDADEKIRKDMVCFPIPAAYRWEITYEDSYGENRIQGGHEGCDIMDTQNREGYIPVVSATDGIITNVGWLYLGGYRVGITSRFGIYYYYAHLASYANGIENGKEVYAGELIGFMGSTGEGDEGTHGMFPVHLHFGIYVTGEQGEEYTVDSFPYLLEVAGR